MPEQDQAPSGRLLAPLGPMEQLRAPRLPRRLVQLFVGLSLFGVSVAMMLRGGLGMAPWDVFHSGVARQVPWSFGTVVMVSSFVVLLLWIPLRQMPGLGTIANSVWIGASSDVALSLVGAPSTLAGQVALMAGGVVLNAVASALYIGSQLGPGPRDGLMTGLHARTGWSIRVIRTSLEVVVLALGWLLGGVVGVGTVAYALGVGPLIQAFMPHLVVRLPHPVRED